MLTMEEVKVGQRFPVRTMEEIEMLFDKQWVLMDELLCEPGPVLKGGRVLYANPLRARVHEYTMKNRPAGDTKWHFAFQYIGRDDDEIVYALGSQE